MAIFNILKKIDRHRWFVCYNCMMQTSHDTMKSVFYSEAPPVDFMGRPMMPCPRCGSMNTRSFQDLKDKQEEAALWGLERIVKKHPRSQFEVNPTEQLKSNP